MRRTLIAAIGWLILAGPSLASEPDKQESGSAAKEPFAAYHETLLSAADNALLNISPSTVPPRGREPDAQVRRTDSGVEEIRLRLFAERFWGGRVEDLKQALLRLQQLRPAMEPILRSEGLPADLIAVVLVESAAQPTALSPRGARGLWQFIPETAQRYGLVVDGRRDERLETEKATRAAARYLRDLYFQFGDWSLALAAYNAGEGSVQQAINRGVSDFLVLSSRKLLPAETRNFVPSVLAAVELLGGPTAFAWRDDTRAVKVERAVLYARMTADD